MNVFYTSPHVQSSLYKSEVDTKIGDGSYVWRRIDDYLSSADVVRAGQALDPDDAV